VFLRLLEKDRIQQSSVVVVEFDNHEILVKIRLPRAESCFSAKKLKPQASISLWCPRSTQRAKRRDSPPLASRGRREAMLWHDNWRRALPRGTRSGVKRNLESTIGLQL
jgi:hypothetical protein